MLEEGCASARYQELSGAGGCGARGGRHCCRCARRRRASPLTCLAICFLVLTYNLLGAFLFLALEGSPPEETAVAVSKPNLSQPSSSGDLRSITVERLWSITEDLNILYKENWTKLAAKELLDFQKVLVKSVGRGDSRLRSDQHQQYRWTFASSFLYALTLITTIGHGNVAPKSAAGKMVAVAYACVGIPVVMVYLAAVGDALARRVRALYAQLRRPKPVASVEPPTQHQTPFQAALNLSTLRSPHWTCQDHARVPVLLSFMLIVLYIAIGTLVFHTTERWTILDGCYFSFSSLATIGFGDLKPGSHASTVSAKAEDIALGVCCVYILVGIVVIAMCFNLIQEDVSAALRGVTWLCAGAVKTHVKGVGDPPEVVGS